MKTRQFITINLLIISILAIFSSCEKWDLTGIKGDGPIVTKDLELADVEGIISEIPASIYLTQGDVQSIRIEAQQNILDNIIESTPNNILKLKFDKNVSKSEPIKVYMTISKLREISISGSGEVLSDTKFVSDDGLHINISGSGNVNVEADANDIELNLAGSGEIKLKTICTDIYGNISGSGTINLENGLAETAEFNISGSGDVLAFNFPIERCWVNTAGSGDARLNVTERLTISIAGSGDVYYKGSPSLSINVVGSGSVVNSN